MAGLREFDWPVASESAPDMQQALDDDGIFVVRNALSRDEVGELRDILRRHLTMDRHARQGAGGKTGPLPRSLTMAPRIEGVALGRAP